MKRNKKKLNNKQKEQHPIEKIYNSFSKNLQGLKIFVSNVAPVVQKHDEELKESITATFKTVTKIIGLDESKLNKKKSQKIKVELTEEQMNQLVHNDILK